MTTRISRGNQQKSRTVRAPRDPAGSITTAMRQPPTTEDAGALFVPERL
jgi:hypothetical protein